MQLDPNAYRESEPQARLILALDVSNREEALRLVEQLMPRLKWVKVGLQLFTATGPELVRELVERGLSVFLDLKFHDIPNTMAGGVRSARELGARFCTVHASAGEGVRSAVRAALETAPGTAVGSLPPAVLAVTVLTSFAADELPFLLDSRQSGSDLVLRLARESLRAGATGLVASAEEIQPLREALGEEPLLVIPGIRPRGSAAQDQSRVATPAEALRRGADFLVIGRPITQADDPRGALLAILDEMCGAL
jgi:orotidine-5'-phosphate decarboxylase